MSDWLPSKACLVQDTDSASVLVSALLIALISFVHVKSLECGTGALLHYVVGLSGFGV